MFISVAGTGARALDDLPAWKGRVLIDATNPVLHRVSAPELNGSTSSEVVTSLVQERGRQNGEHPVRDMLAADPSRTADVGSSHVGE